MTPAWILPMLPIMLTVTIAALMGKCQLLNYALPILVAGATFQGLGMLISIFMYSIYLSRLMTQGLPKPDLRPGMFIAVGPPSFTGFALLSISNDLFDIHPSYTTLQHVIHPEFIADIFHIVALSTTIFLWATAFWFFRIALVGVIHGAFFTKEGMGFHLVWWAFIFPNVGFTVITIDTGNALMSEGIRSVASVMTLLLVATWLFVGGLTSERCGRRKSCGQGKTRIAISKEAIWLLHVFTSDLTAR
ncbi:uncharacterized protein L3040_001499 [Drepanopeziza brunnea f. sp. 'multigermtubi']|nr:hypothetical protein L3040_001499 [Drepanopeziza brunnea f. sp. 'multigermtubi']